MSMKIYNLTINLVIIADIYICHKVVKALSLICTIYFQYSY